MNFRLNIFSKLLFITLIIFQAKIAFNSAKEEINAKRKQEDVDIKFEDSASKKQKTEPQVLEKKEIVKQIALDRSTFKDIVEKQCIYVDKTEFIYNLFNGVNRFYFLSRPRRFGKTLLISTLKELFTGNKELFKDTWIYNSDWDWQKYPIIHLDFSLIDNGFAKNLEDDLVKHLQLIANKYQLDTKLGQTPKSALFDLITQLSDKTNQKVVLLVDEYDKHILDAITNKDKNLKEDIRESLRKFYSSLKGLDDKLRAIFITGITKFSKVSLFSGLNNLNDITIDSRSSKLLGYTKEEIDRYFMRYIEDFSQKKGISKENIINKMTSWYNGYRFSKEDIKVFNPFSLNYFLEKQALNNYWYESGSSYYLLQLLKNKFAQFQELKNDTEYDESSLGNFDVENIPLIPLLFQAGYLTINSVKEELDEVEKLKYTLRYPNFEVKESFERNIIEAFADIDAAQLDSRITKLKKAILSENFKEFITELKRFFASISYNILGKNEAYYHSLCYALFYACGFKTRLEDYTSIGRIDLDIELKDKVYIFEFKYGQSAVVALKQIKDNRYFEKFLNLGKKIVLVGLSFSQNKELDHEIEELQ